MLRDIIRPYTQKSVRRVEVPEWGNAVVGIRTLSLRESDSLLAFASDDPELRIRAIILAAVEPDQPHVQAFDENDMEWLFELSRPSIHRLSDPVLADSFPSKAAIDQEKNS